ncbi:hypothetical protein [Paraburkholderia strydomiana]|jgi:hypothetical protein|uniref:hypothetical protein n=1 Tax=Paraburkholderia strydomiana TaxID=1245417 RepID=UPI0038B98CE7
MRTALRIDPIRFARCAALCAAIALIALPAGVHAETAQAQFADAAHTPLAGTERSATPSTDWATGTATESGPLAANAPDTESVSAISLDDQMLSRQRGGAAGMVMVAATPQLLRGNSGGRVTLWDEIAPPLPLPIPVDAAPQGAVHRDQLRRDSASSAAIRSVRL